MHRLAILLLVCLGAIPNASAQSGKIDIQTILAKEQNPQCVLAGTKNIICYAASTKTMYQSRVGEGAVSTRTLLSLPATKQSETSSPSVDTQLSDLSAQEDGDGNIVVAWQYSRDFIDTINLLYVRPDGQVQHNVVKSFEPRNGFFDLKTFVVGQNVVRFFYTYYSEKYFSPISDTGSIQKLWTLGWRDGKTVFDVQLSEKGRVHTTRYDASYRGDGKFELAWLEERIGSFLGPGRKFKTGMVFDDRGTPQLKEIGETSMNQLEPQDKAVFPIVAPAGNQDFRALASISYDSDGVIYKKLSSSGKVLGERRVAGAVVAEFGYDSGTPPLFRYVKGRLTHFLKPPPSIKAEIHWTDFDGHDWAEQLDVPFGSIFPKQNVGNCFYWMQPDRGNLDVRKKCRSGG